MIRFVLAAAAAFALAGAAPALACGEDCPMHKAKTASADTKVAATDKAEKKDEKVTCACHDAKECKCMAKGKCDCSACGHDHHDHDKKEKKGEEKKS
jgi:flagellar motility protein MotE (MotC chaperone)